MAVWSSIEMRSPSGFRVAMFSFIVLVMPVGTASASAAPGSAWSGAGVATGIGRADTAAGTSGPPGPSLTKAADRAQRDCGLRQARTLAATKQMRLYELAAEDGSGPGTVYACIAASGRRARLGPVSPGGIVGSAWVYGPFALTTPWAGGFETQASRDTARVFSVARSVPSGESRRCQIGGARQRNNLPSVKRALLNGHGTLVWGAVLKVGAEGPEIGACEPSGARILDSGGEVDPRSVRLKGTTVSWIDAGVKRSAVIH